ncbi:hypothetical protein BH09DEP1_BH09DEP1_3360 [soil metagenome]
MLKTNYILSVALLFSIPVLAMDNPAAGNKEYQNTVHAVRIGNLDQLREIARTNPTLNFSQISQRGLPLIHIAAIQGRVDVMHYLVRVLSLDPKITINGQNILHVTASRGNIDMVKYLVDMAEFDINAKDGNQKTALDLAKQNNREQIASYLSSKLNKKAARPLPTPPAKPAAKAPAPPVVAKPVTKSCIICAEDRQPDQFITLSCGHEYCRECLAVMLDTAIKDKSSRALKCPTCNHTLENDLHKITDSHAKIVELSDIQLQEYLSKEQNTKNCPTTNCGFSFINERADQFTMQCPDCKAEYCGKCIHTHNPRTSCQHAEQERNLATDRNAQAHANQQWLEQNTKPCPRCGTRTEKNGGCMHMTCRNCNYHYCWNCLGEFVNHADYYSCQNRTRNPIAPQAPQQPVQEQITQENMHLLFARDPRGFAANLAPELRAINFAERFMRLSCAAQEEWTAHMAQAWENDQWNYIRQLNTHWINELNRLEPFTLATQVYQATQEGTFVTQITGNRDLSLQLQTQIQEWIINKNPQDMIMFRGWINGLLYGETSLSRERLQEVLDQASRHFRNNREVQGAPTRAQAVQNDAIYDAYQVPYEEAPPFYEEQPNPWDHIAPAINPHAIHGFISGVVQQFVAGRPQSSITITLETQNPQNIGVYEVYLRVMLGVQHVIADSQIRGNTIVLTNGNQVINRDLIQTALDLTNQRFRNR